LIVFVPSSCAGKGEREEEKAAFSLPSLSRSRRQPYFSRPLPYSVRLRRRPLSLPRLPTRDRFLNTKFSQAVVIETRSRSPLAGSSSSSRSRLAQTAQTLHSAHRHAPTAHPSTLQAPPTSPRSPPSPHLDHGLSRRLHRSGQAYRLRRLRRQSQVLHGLAGALPAPLEPT
jgi:hypothetical protein